jgi:murein DD-endopeptidase MepM/ murein hydrolase activator NlpD
MAAALPLSRKSLPQRGISRSLFAAVLCLLAASNSATLIGLLTDSRVAALWVEAQDGSIVAYVSRISELRREVDRLRSKEFAGAGQARLRVQDLVDLQLQIGEQLDTVQSFVKRATDLGIDMPAPQSAADLVHDRGDGLVRVSRLDAVEMELRDIQREANSAMTTMAAVADRSADAIIEELRRIGHGPDLGSRLASGGPLLPVGAPGLYVQVTDGSAVLAALAKFTAAREAMNGAPIHKPVDASRISSGYGTRKDPFAGQSAFHSGIDFPAPTGTPVRSAAKGVVTFVGWRDGYGNVVEISHESGLVSRYPHLSKSLVEEGDEVEADAKVALVGSTGRSTGPHLHFEIRRRGQAIDPSPFLAVGKRLEAFDT